MLISQGGRFNLTRLEPMLEDIHERMVGIIIECLPWQEFITRWDRAGMLFYLDPPYWGCENDYGKEVFSRDDFAEMAETLKGLQGHFILSLNDVQGVRETFSDFDMETVDCRYSIAGGKGKAVKEVIISGHRPCYP